MQEREKLEKEEREKLGPTDMSPPSRRYYTKLKVKVVLQDRHALITSQDGSFREQFPVGMVEKRFKKNETTAYFNVIVKPGSDVPELEERLADQGW